MKKMVCVLVGCGVLLSPSLYATANRADVVSLSLGAGYEFFSNKRHMQNHAAQFGMIGYNFSRQWGVEAFVDGYVTRFKRSVDNKKQINANLITVDGLYYFPDKWCFQPYAMAGVGMQGFHPNLNDANNEGNINGGFGLAWFANRLVALRVEARDIYTIVGGKNDVFVDGAITFYLDVC